MYLILGMGKSGQAVRAFCQAHAIAYRCLDKKTSEGIFSDQERPNLEGVTKLIKSPGIVPTHPWIVEAKKQGIAICTEIDLALPLLLHKKLIAITGSNGKTTTALALKHALAGQAACVGNIGMPLLQAVEHPAPILIVELSSFQLDTIQEGPWFDYGVILNITANHLDYHLAMEHYMAAKWRLKNCIKQTGQFLIEKDFLPFTEKVETFFKQRYRETGDTLYPHDKKNFAAVWAICQKLGCCEKEFAEQITQFTKPPHRLEFVGVCRGLRVINDSKSTSVDATQKAVEALRGPLVLILGGVDKGGDYRQWIPTFTGKVKQVFTIGTAAPLISHALKDVLPVQNATTLHDAINLAFDTSTVGDTLLLSPGCASYDQFSSYEERGELFKQLIQQKIGEGGQH